MDFLQLQDRRILVMGVANKKSVAWHIAKTLEEAGAHVIYSVRSEQRKEQLEAKLLSGREIHICDVESTEQIQRLAADLAKSDKPLHGLVHSLSLIHI